MGQSERIDDRHAPRLIARIDHAASAARHDLRDCLRRDYGIDETMADQLNALL